MAKQVKTHSFTPQRRKRGFERTSGLLQSHIRKATESRGFAVTRLLTHWEEIVGKDVASMAHPVKVGYGRGGFGATLTILTKGAYAPMLQSQLPAIKEKVNACYGYAAISRIHVTQTAPTGFAEGQVQFQSAPKKERLGPTPEIKARAHETTADVGDSGLRAALDALGANIITKQKSD
ncbi:MAG: DciA family protein [Pseudoruegeria sp.]